MSLFFMVILAAIAWLIALAVDTTVHLWHLCWSLPPWLVLSVVLSSVAWFVADS